MALRRETPLPWAKLSVLLIVRFIEPLNFSLVLPFLYEMVKGLDIANAPQDVSFYAGLLLTSFYISQSLTSMLWSPLSDRIGRRPVLLLCLVGDLATFVLFGFSKSFAWALAARSLNGLFTGNSALLKSVVVDIADDTNRARMMSLLPLVFFAGNIAGAAIGGVLADPARQYPHLFGDIGLFIEYPYLLAANIAPSKASIGAMNGLQQMAMGYARVVGPLISGWVWSWSAKHWLPFALNTHLAWLACCLLTLSALWAAKRLPASVNVFTAR